MNMKEADSDSPALYLASLKGHASCTQLLLGARAEVDALTKDGLCALYASCQSGKVECVELLLGANAKVRCRWHGKHGGGCGFGSPLRAPSLRSSAAPRSTRHEWAVSVCFRSTYQIRKARLRSTWRASTATPSVRAS